MSSCKPKHFVLFRLCPLIRVASLSFLCVCVKIEKLVNCEDRLDNDDPALLRHGEFLRAKLFSWQEF
jgi:hypothetical protein